MHFQLSRLLPHKSLEYGLVMPHEPCRDTVLLQENSHMSTTNSADRKQHRQRHSETSVNDTRQLAPGEVMSPLVSGCAPFSDSASVQSVCSGCIYTLQWVARHLSGLEAFRLMPRRWRGGGMLRSPPVRLYTLPCSSGSLQRHTDPALP